MTRNSRVPKAETTGACGALLKNIGVDGGGVVSEALRPIEGAERVAAFPVDPATRNPRKRTRLDEAAELSR
jgi:hypothetical protein